MSGTRDYHEIFSGMLLMAIGGFAALYGAAHLPLGTLMQVGPGGFPVALGVILFLCGAIVFLPALKREGVMPKVEFRPAVMVLGAGVVFGLTLEHIGLIPAAFLLVVIAASGDDKLRMRAKLTLAAVLCALAFLIFKVGLSLPVVAARWPF